MFIMRNHSSRCHAVGIRPRAAWTVSVAGLLLLVAAAAWAGEPVVVGEPPPRLPWITAAGDTVMWDELGDGTRPVVMVFWATWCSACRKEWPRYQELSDRFGKGPHPPLWFSVSVGEPVSRAAGVAAERDLPGSVLGDPKESSSKAIGLRYVPAVCLVDAAGNVAYFGDSKPQKISKLLSQHMQPPPSEENP